MSTPGRKLVTELAPASSLTGDELVYVVQGLGDKQTTTGDIAALADGNSFALNTSWVGLVMGFASPPTGPTLVTGGKVYTYTYLGPTIRYRFIANNGTMDAFYTDFDGTNVTGLVTTKTLSF